jgi:phage terminase large subunit-like protein
MSWLLSLDDVERRKALQSLSEGAALAAWDWLKDPKNLARPEQIEPVGNWFIWLCKAGRGWGKTQTGSWFVRQRIDAGTWKRVNICGRTSADVRDVMIDGPSGLMEVWPPHQRPLHEPSKMRVVAHNGVPIRYMSADEPESFRGPQADGGWADEIDAWKPTGMNVNDAWSLFELGIRLGPDPRIIATSTPKRGRLVKSLKDREDVTITGGSTYDNQANLAATFITAIVNRHKGTRLGRQEINGELLPDVAGALVTPEMIDRDRWRNIPTNVKRIVVGVDPSGTEDGSEKGIVVDGVTEDDQFVCLQDASCRGGPAEWGRRVVNIARFWKADCIAVEANYGGDMALHVVESAARRTPQGLHGIRVKKVIATRGKHVRFEPCGALYERGEMHHVGSQPDLEDQVTGFTASGFEGDADSPDRGDAHCWALTELMSRGRGFVLSGKEMGV